MAYRKTILLFALVLTACPTVFGRTIESDFEWMKNGRVVRRDNSYGRTAGWLYYLVKEREDPALINGSMDCINKMVTIQQFKLNELRSVIDKYFPRMLSRVFSEHGDLLDQERINSYKWYLDPARRELASKRKISGDTIATLEGLLKTSGSSIEGGEWRSIFFVISRSGTIERWHAGGSIEPFKLSVIERKVVIQPGNVPVIPRIG